MTHAELLAAGYEVSPAAHALLERFVERLLHEIKRLNLISGASAGRVWTTHVCDSLALLPMIREMRCATLLDLGAGGGLPGIPLACAEPALRVTLLDATAKKVAAVERMTGALGVHNVRCVAGRAETLAHDPLYREQFDAVTARAVGELAELVELSAGFVRPGGSAWFFKTRAAGVREVAAAENAARACAFEYISSCPYGLPVGQTERVIVIYRKCAVLDAHLPRSVGRPKKRPL